MKKENTFIFDLQLFDTPAEKTPVTVSGNSNNEEINISMNSGAVAATSKVGTGAEENLTVAGDNNEIKGVNAGGGNDTIKVGAGVENIVIVGGVGADLIDITNGDGKFNTYQYASGDGDDTIKGWKNGDTFQITSGIADATALGKATMMSADGNNFIIKVGQNTITFEGTDASSKVSVQTADGNKTEIIVPKLMQGDSNDNTFTNTGDNKKAGTANTAGDYYIIDAQAGNDNITNAADYVSISGGAGQDSIKIQAGDNVNNNITINAGTGNDTIDVLGDTLAGDTTTYGKHVYEYTAGDGHDIIVGFHAGDEILITDATGITATTIKENSDVSGNDYIIKVGTGSITLKDAVGGTALGLKFRAAASDSYTAIDGMATVPKKIKGTALAEDITVKADKSDYAVEALAGNDNITVQAAKVSVSGGAGNDSITVKDGTNVPATADDEANAKADDTKAVTIYGGEGNDTINVADDKRDVKKTGEDTTLKSNVLATHVYEYNEGDGNDVIVGFNESDTIKIIPKEAGSAISAEGIKEAAVYDGKDLTIKIGTGSIVLKNVTGGKGLNILLGDTQIANFNKIPAKVTGTSKSEEFTADVDEYIIDAAAGNDTITVSAAQVSVSAGTGNDIISLGGGTNVVYDEEHKPATADAAIDNTKVVTVYGGAGNDSINALEDKKSVTLSDNKNQDVYASHVYQFGTADGKDTITGFNSNDSIVITATAGDEITGEFAEDGKSYIIKAGTTSVALVFDERFKQGSQIQVYKDVSGTKTAVDTISEIPKIIYGTSSHDSVTTGDNKTAITNAEDDYTIKAFAGNDIITNTGASNVSIEGGAGNDTINLVTKTVDSAPVYGANVTIEGGTGDDSIVAETKDATDGSYQYKAADPNAPGHIYYFGNSDGNDTVIGFNENDTIKLKDDTFFYEAALAENKKDVIFKVAKAENASKETATITLKDYAVGKIDRKITYITANNETVPYLVPNILTGTTGDDTVDATTGDHIKLVNEGNEYQIKALAGNDLVENSGGNVTIFGGAGKDTIKNSGNDAYIYGEAGNDLVSITGTGALISLGAGTDTVVNEATTGAQVYSFGSNDGVNYILNYRAEDVIRFTDVTGLTMEAIVPENTADGLKIVVGNTTVYVKGAIKDGTITDDTEKIKPSNYKNLEGGVEVNFQIGNGEVSSKIVEKVIYGTTGNDEGTNSIINLSTDKYNADGYKIDALAGNDSIVSDGANVTINGNAGNDIISLGSAAVSNSIIGGKGNDVIYGNVEDHVGHIYHYNSGDGNDTIFGFTANDTLQINGASYTSAETTSDGFTVKIGTSTVILKGTKKAGATGDTFADFNNIEGGTVIHIKDATDGDRNKTAASQLLGTSKSEQLENTFDGYTVEALGGNDTVENNANNVSISGGAGNDSIKLVNGSGVTVTGDAGNDIITIADDNTNGNVIEFNTGNGTDTVLGVGAEDTIKLGSNYTDASFDSDGYYVLTLSNTSKIKLKGKNNAKLNGKTFYVQVGDAAATPIEVPNEITFDSYSSAITLTDENHNAGIIIGSDGNDSITNNAAALATIKTGKGDDSINIGASATDNVIIGGAGKDTVNFVNSSGHTVEYTKGDGNDVITGWSEDNVLKISGLTEAQLEGAISLTAADVTPTNAGNLVVKVGTSTITLQSLVPQSKVRFVVDEMTDGKEYVEYTVPKLVQGTKNDDKGDKSLYNLGGDEYIMKGLEGNDYIDNATASVVSGKTTYVGENVTIDAGTGNDTVLSSGGQASIVGGTGDDSINSSGSTSFLDGGAGNDEFIVAGADVTVDGGDGNDKISLTADASATSIEAGKGNDTIYGNANGNTYLYDASNSNKSTDLILGYDVGDTIQIKGTTVTEGKVTSDGYIIKLANGGSLTLKGARKADPAGYNQSDYENLVGGTPLNIQVDATGSGTFAALAPALSVAFEKYVDKGLSITNADDNHNIIADSGNEKITNSGNGVTVNADKGDDIVINTGSNVSISGGAGKDTIVMNTAENYSDLTNIAAENADASGVTIEGGAGDDVIYGNAGGHTYQYTSGEGNDIIYGFSEADIISLPADTAFTSVVADTSDNQKKDITLKFTSGSIVLKDLAVDSMINISVDGTPTTLTVPKSLNIGSDNAAITNTLDGYTIQGTDKANTITNQQTGTNVVINAQNGNNTITNAASTTQINAGTGNDKITNTAANVIISAGKGNNTIDNSGATTSITTAEGNDSIKNAAAADVTISAGDGKNYIENAGNNAEITAGTGNDTVKNEGSYSQITTGEGNDSITNSGTDVQIDAGDGKNEISNTGDGAIITAGTGNDTITNSGSDVQITTGEGNNKINLEGTATNVIITMGSGNDTVYGNETGGQTYVLESGANGIGNKVFLNYNAADVIQIKLAENESVEEKSTTTEGYVLAVVKTETDADGTTVETETGTITLAKLNSDGKTTSLLDGGTDINLEIKDFEGNSVNTEITASPKVIIGTTGNDAGEVKKLTNEEEGYRIEALAGNDEIVNSGENVIINANAGKNTITNEAAGIGTQINAHDGANTVTNHAENVTMVLGNGKNTIDNKETASSSNITTGTGADSIVNAADDVIINAGAGKNIIANTGYNANITTGKDADNITNGASGEEKGAGSIIRTYQDATDAGNDTVTNYAGNVLIEAGAGKNEITNAGDGVTITASAGDDEITNSGSDVQINAGDGKNKINLEGEATNVTVNLGKGNSTVYGNDIGGQVYVLESDAEEGIGNKTFVNYQSADAIQIKLQAGESIAEDVAFDNKGYVISIIKTTTDAETGDTSTETTGTLTFVKLDSANKPVLINGGTEINIKYSTNGTSFTDATPFITPKVVLDDSGNHNNTNLENTEDEHNIYAYEGNDTIINSGSNLLIDADDGGAKDITNSGDEVTINTAEGYDTITHSGNYAVINTGTGNDIVKLEGTATGSTVTTGEGKDTIYANATGGSNIFYFDSANASENVIVNYTADDAIHLKLADGETVTTSAAREGFTISVLNSEEKATGFSIKLVKLDSSNKPTLIDGGIPVALNIVNDASTITDSPEITTPKVIYGTAGNDTGTSALTNENGTDYLIEAYAGNDDITNGGGNATIYAGLGNDTITNAGENSYIEADAGTDKVINSGAGSTIYAGAGIDTIFNSDDNVYIDGGADNDIIKLINADGTTEADPEGVTIKGGAGNDTITLKDERTNGVVFEYATGDGADVIEHFNSNDTIKIDGNYSTTVTNNGFRINVGNGSILLKDYKADDDSNPEVKILAGDAEEVTTIHVPNVVSVPTADNTEKEEVKWTYNNTAEYALINGTTGNDTMTNNANEVAIYGAAGIDSIINTSGDNVYIDGGAGNNIIANESGDEVTIKGGNNNDNITNKGDKAVIEDAGGTNTIGNEGDEVSIKGGSAADNINNSGDNVTIDAGAGANFVTNTGGAAYIKGGAVVDNIYSSGDNATIEALAGNDNIYIGTRDGNTITLEDAEGVVIAAGAGNDNISVATGHSNGVIYQFGKADGNNVITGFNENDTIQITAEDTNYSWLVSQVGTGANATRNIELTIGTTKVMLKGYGSTGDTFNISTYNAENEDYETEQITVPEIQFGTASNDKITVSLEGAGLVQALAGNDSITNEVDEVTIKAGAGNDSIKNSASSVLIQGELGTNTIINEESAEEVTIEGGTGNENITNNGGSAVISGGAGADRIINTAGGVEINGDDANDTVDNSGTEVTINGGAGVDSIKNTASSVTINGDAGADVIANSAANVLIDAGADADRITLTGEDIENLTIIGGTGNDIINATAVTRKEGKGLTFQYSAGDGNDSINGFNLANDIVQIMTDDITEDDIEGAGVVSNAGYVVTVGGGVLTFAGVTAGANIRFVKSDGRTALKSVEVPNSWQGTTGNDNYTNKADGVEAMYMLAGNDTVINAKSGTDENSVIIATNTDKSTTIAGVKRITNTGNYVDITTGTGNDIITNEGSNVNINVGNGTNNVTLNGTGETAMANIEITGGTGTENVVIKGNVGEGITADLGAGNDNVSVAGGTVALDMGAGNNNVSVSGGTVTIDDSAGVSNNTNRVTVEGADTAVTVTGGAGAENITVKAGTVELDLKDGNDNVSISGGTISKLDLDDGTNAVTLAGGTLNNGITFGKDADTLVLNTKVTGATFDLKEGANRATISTLNGGAETTVTIKGGAGIDAVTVQGGADVTLDLGAGNNTAAISGGSKVALTTADGADKVTISGGSNITANLGAGANTASITNANAKNVAITTGAGNDSIGVTANATNVNINTGAGNDTVSVTNGTGITVDAGEGNDTISLHANAKGVTINYSKDGGTDIITAFNADDFITFGDGVSDLSYEKSGNNLLVKSGDTTIMQINGVATAINALVEDGGKYKLGTKTEETGGTTGRIAKDPIAAMDLFEDNNFMTNDAQISDITAITHDNYSAGNIETFDLEKVVQSNYATSAAYGKDKK